MSPAGEERAATLAMRGFGYSYPEAAEPALSGIDLTIEPGEFVLLAGSSGSGKSTLLRAFAGLVPHFFGGVAHGSVSVAGTPTRELQIAEVSEQVGSLFQDPETQVVLSGVRAEIAFPLQNRGWEPARIARAVEETSLALGVDHLLSRSTDGLSGGELQRVALAATLAGGACVVCLDEPTSQLDPVAGDELISLLKRLNQDTELTVLLSEHRLERCLPAADRVLALDQGRLCFDGPPDDFLAWALDQAPGLATPGARLLAQAGLAPVAGVRGARQKLRGAGLQLRAAAASAPSPEGVTEPALELDGVWHEVRSGPTILRGVDLRVSPGEKVALMGRNGAGKSTLLRHAAKLMQPTRGTVSSTGPVRLLLQNPNDYLVHETVAQETSALAVREAGLAGYEQRHPRDLSGGERQRLALAIVLAQEQSGKIPAVVCLDEPTRGMDRAHKSELIRRLRRLDAAVLVATHDPEFAAAVADRVILLADGQIIADGPASELLAGGTYFATETARIAGGAEAPLLPEQAQILNLAGPVPDVLVR